MRILLAVLLTISILSVIGFLFWEQEWKFSKPTPVPSNHITVQTGDSIPDDVISMLGLTSADQLFIHFYNFDCPCSRFNIKEFQNLVIQYESRVKFLAVLETVGEEDSEVKDFVEKYDMGIDIYLDHEGLIAKKLGVYSTPQAVLIKNQQIYFSGNYNKARFCTTQNTKFASLALSAMVEDRQAPVFPELATVAYGCELPANGNTNTRFDKFFNFLSL
ncbi:AhpC/TSA family protein [Marivirga sericea]|uniref:AhpC/TSA family protein n=1 Tax=Marivirga sericea TaxID=1028 RepID=A0A1X7KXL6_9BACT|nr:redoxin domain-containing protein [Marivirga sericea]SMG46180.1 AhpC/TSA family protein [Marivirga sericea]